MSTICPKFAQNAWKKDLCSNCFKSKEEHKMINHDTRPLLLTPKQIDPPKGIMKSQQNKLPKGNVKFPEELSQVIGFGGEWSDDESGSDMEDESMITTPEDTSKDIDEIEQELLTLTKINTDFNMSNANLSNDNNDNNIKRTFATLQLGTPVKDSNGKKQTLKISVMPFGGPVTTNKVNNIKQKFNGFDETKAPVVLKTIIKTTGVEYVEEPMKVKSFGEQQLQVQKPEKTLMEEISETLEKNKVKMEKEQEQESKTKIETKKVRTENKRSISRHTPIIKDQTKPKISVFPKFSDTDSYHSDNENGSGYYDVVEATSNYENLPSSYEVADNIPSQTNEALNNEINLEIRNKNKSSFFSNHLISEMFSSSKDRKNSNGYNFMSKITTDGLIVTKASSDDAMDSTGSSFDYATSSDEEMSSMNRSESDSGIGICVTNSPNELEKDIVKIKYNANIDYEDIQVSRETVEEKLFSINKSRELAGEPDGSADPDGKTLTLDNEAPELPSSPPPVNSEARKSFLHKTSLNEKPTVPVKPTVSIIKAFVKRSPNVAEQQVITQLQQIMKPYPSIDSSLNEKSETLQTKIESSESQKNKKTRAPDPPSPTENRPSEGYENVKVTTEKITAQGTTTQSKALDIVPFADTDNSSTKLPKTDDQYTYLYTRNPTGSIGKSSSPVIREKDKRERATVNPKFRSLNTFSSKYKNQADKTRPTTPEPAPRNVLSMSQDCLLDDKKKRNKFSIKKFLRMGSNKSSEPIYDKKEGNYGKMMLADRDGMPGDRSPKPRLVIIHPIDINQMEVEVVKEMGKVSEIVTGKPPAPPLRKGLDVSNKPTRPPPPKSAEVRKKLKIGFNDNNAQKSLTKEDSVYANLGEIRSSIAPRKPERTASMREREAQLELARKRLSTKHEFKEIVFSEDSLSAHSTLEKASTKSDVCKVSSRLELFERTISEQKSKSILLNDGIKSSMQKMSSTIDSYLKDRMSESDESKLTAQPDAVCKSNRNSINNNRHSEVELRNNYEPIALNSERSSLPDNSSNYKTNALVGRTGNTKSDYGTRYQSHSIANIARAVSRSYCGSEISETDIYSPYSFYGSETGTDVANSDVYDGWSGHQQSMNRQGNRLRMRKGRSVVHKNLEDNYGAVVVANHEALAQVLEQLQKSTTISLPLRPLANSMNLRFEDFTILEGVRGVVAGRRAFHPAVWANQTHVTLALSVDCNQMADMNPITEFCDLVPSHYLPIIPNLEIKMLQATISVLPRMLVDTLQSFGQMLKIRSENLKTQSYGSTMNLSDNHPLLLRNSTSAQNLSTYENNDNEIESVKVQIPGMPSYDDLLYREVGFVMLQLVNGLKTIQAKGIEELPLSLSNVIICKDLEFRDVQARLCVLHGLNQDLSREDEEPMGTLCQCAHNALTSILPTTKLTTILTKILLKDRSESLSKAKSVLEYALWGPSDVPLNGSNKERELALQRWLDLERATILHGLVRSRVELSAYDECHLMFLVRSSAKIMSEASSILTGSVENDD